MEFVALIDAVRALLKEKGRVTYRTLRRQFDLDDETLADITEELIYAEQTAVDEDGRLLIWREADGSSAKVASVPVKRPNDALMRPPPVANNVLPERQSAPAGERRQLTVMFCDIVGSTQMSQQLDPEALHRLIGDYQTACGDVIARYEGHVAQYLGDGLLVYFGYPSAHEDDANRAVHAALEILEQLKTASSTRSLDVRIGVHTGPVVVGNIGAGNSAEQLAVGETPNIAARMQSAAAPNTIVISPKTANLVRGFFATESLGEHSLPGLGQPVELFRVAGKGRATDSFDVSRHAGLTPLVGREEELELLERRWQRALAGEGQAVLLSGEPGIGKSRLLQALRDRSQGEDHYAAVYRCSSYFQNSAYYPMLERTQKFLRFEATDPADIRFNKLRAALQTMGMADDETVALFATALSIPMPDTFATLQLGAQKQKEKLLDAFATWAFKLAEKKPFRIEFEDLHWADASTLEFLGMLLDRLGDSRILLVMTYRLEFTPPWPLPANCLSVHVGRLSQQRISDVAVRVAGKSLPEEVVAQLVSKSDGVPLYIEEMTKNLLESSQLIESDDGYAMSTALPEMAIPSSLQDSLNARLDRLSPVRHLAQIGAVLGRSFSFALLQPIAKLDDAALESGLEQLTEAGIFFKRGSAPAATYTFKHALLQDAAYSSLLNSQRRQFHAQVATELEQNWPEICELQPELLAHHYIECEQYGNAVPHWRRAGMRAVSQFANDEAIRHFESGLKALQELPETAERDRMELELQLALAIPLTAINGFAAERIGEVYLRARELSVQVKQGSEIMPMLWGLCAFYITRGEHLHAHTIASQMVRLGHNENDPEQLIPGQFLLSFVSLYLGDLDTAHQLLEQVNEAYSPAEHHHLTFKCGGIDPGVACLCETSWTLWYLGFPERACEKIDQALALAHELSHTFSLAFAHYYAAILHDLLRDPETAIEHARAAIEISTEMGFPYQLAMGKIMHGIALADSGDRETGVSQALEGSDGLRAIGAEVLSSYLAASVGRVMLDAGRRDDGLAQLKKGLEIVERCDERYHEAELQRLYGEALLFGPLKQTDQAAAHFRQALTIAREQHSTMLELRAACSLARLLVTDGETSEARELLQPIYDSFSEGLERPDLKDAHAVLQSIS